MGSDLTAGLDVFFVYKQGYSYIHQGTCNA